MRKIIFRNKTLQKDIRPILDQWIENVEVYTNKAFKAGIEEFPGLYNERANVSIFAAAAWQCGYIALEEYGYPKRKPEDKQETHSGRIDLWVLCNKQECVFEAKRVEVSISSRASKYVDNIKDALSKARGDAVDSRDTGQQAIGLVFIVPYYPKGEADPDQCIAKFLNDIKEIDYGFMAYTFPKETEKLLWDRYYCPGIVLMGRVPRRVN